MIRTVKIENYKSIPNLTLELGRVTVLIGTNGSGKSNILEAFAFAAAASQGKLDNEFLATRGIRVTEPEFMRSNFSVPQKQTNGRAVSKAKGDANAPADRITFKIKGDQQEFFQCNLHVDQSASYPKWQHLSRFPPDFVERIRRMLEPIRENLTDPEIVAILRQSVEQQVGSLLGFLIYTPENSALRTFQNEGQILPLGIRGEGLFAHLKALTANKYMPRLKKIKEHLSLMEWFETFEIPTELSPGERRLLIRDRYLTDGAMFDQRSANEGFLFLLFYMTLMISPDTPAFFAIDNMDSSLNPKLCTALLKQVVSLAREYDKQVIVTTHNPAVLDGLELADDDQRLLVVDRNRDGHTRVARVEPLKPVNGSPSMSLSEAFIRGFIGGVPTNF